MQSASGVLNCHLLPPWLSHVFIHYLISAQFSGRVTDYKMFVLVLSTLYIKHFSLEEKFSNILS